MFFGDIEIPNGPKNIVSGHTIMGRVFLRSIREKGNLVIGLRRARNG